MTMPNEKCPCPSSCRWDVKCHGHCNPAPEATLTPAGVPSGETEAQRIEVVTAWNDLPDTLRAHPGLKRLYRALGGIKRDDGSASTSEPAPQAVQAQALERTPKDYAIEHAGYMATDAERLLEAIEALSAAELRLEEAGEDDDGTVADARDDVWSATRSLRSGIYEFRKRRDRARTLASASDAAQTDSKLLEQALSALEYHREQTRPILRTEAAIAALRVRLGKESGK